MTIPASFPPRISHGTSVTAPSLDGAPAGASADPPDLVQAPGSWPWRRAALLLSIAAQPITIAALEGADPIPATWAALLLAVVPAPLALVVAFAPAPAARLAAPLAVVVLVIGIIGQVTHTGLFFVPALAAMIVAAVRLWRERD
jgi:hypothetical protein